MHISATDPDSVILIVDDASEIIDLLRVTLTKAGFSNIHATTDSRKAASLFYKVKPDVMLLDLMMPKFDGYDVLKEIQNENPKSYIPIIIMTADQETDTKFKAMQMGAKDFITKPFSNFDLLVRVNTISEMSSLYKSLELKNFYLFKKIKEQTSKMQDAIELKDSAEEQLRLNMMYDAVTGLPNKILLDDRLKQLVQQSKRDKVKFALVIFGIDDFMEINNTLGQKLYNKLLKNISKKLKASLRVSDTVSSLNVDELEEMLTRVDEQKFTIVIPNYETTENIELVVSRCLSHLSQPFDVSGVSLDIIIRAGIALYPDHGESVEDILQHANVAHYNARNDNLPWIYYDAEHDVFIKHRLNLMSELKAALSEDNLTIYYQPKIDLVKNCVHSCEALIRWQHSIHGFIPPDTFIPIAERTGTIRILTKWVLEKVISQCAEWLKNNMRINVSINLSTVDLKDDTIVNTIKTILKTHKVPPYLITLEVTESSVMSDPTTSVEVLNHLFDLGMKLSIDDYGTGYSSLSYLKSLPVAELKIDKSFVLEMDKDNDVVFLDKDNDDVIIVKSTIDLAHNLSLNVVAEGIENEDIYNKLKDLGCDIGQGYYISRPLPAEEFEQWMKTSPWGYGANTDNTIKAKN